MDWLETLGWSENDLEDLRFVGYSYIKQGLYDIAIKLFEGLCALSSDNCYDLQTLGALYLQKGNNLEALDHLDRAIKIDPTNLSVHINKAKALFLLGHKTQGFEIAKKLTRCTNKEIIKQAQSLISTFV